MQNWFCYRTYFATKMAVIPVLEISQNEFCICMHMQNWFCYRTYFATKMAVM